MVEGDHRRRALHGSSLEALRGVEALRGLVTRSDQVLVLALPIMATLGIVVDDEYVSDLDDR